MVRMIAEQMDETERCSITYNPGFISRSLGFRSLIDCRSFLDRLANDCGLISVVYGNEWVVTCDKLLKLRNYKTRSAAYSKCTDKDQEVEKEIKKNNTTISPKGDSPIDQNFEEFWKEYPRKVSKQTALKIWVRLKLESSTIPQILSALQKQKQSEQWQRDGGQFIPHPTTWLNQRRWEDQVVVIEDWAVLAKRKAKERGLI